MFAPRNSLLTALAFALFCCCCSGALLGAAQDETVTVEAELVSLDVRVEDALRRPVRNLRREDFRVYEDGAPQTIALFSTEEAPVSYGLVVCYSGVDAAQFGRVVEAGKTVVESNRPGDETFVARFADARAGHAGSDEHAARIEWRFTSDKKALAEALEALHGGEASRTLVDALYLSVEHVAAQSGATDGGGSGTSASRGQTRRRRALIVVTDGDDHRSFYTKEQLFALLRREDVQVYTVGFVGELRGGHEPGRVSERARAVSFLNRLASETGGRAFYPNSTRDLPLVAAEIARDLRAQYTIGYSPSNKARDGSFRAVRVTVSDAPDGLKRTAITRPGYTAPR